MIYWVNNFFLFHFGNLNTNMCLRLDEDQYALFKGNEWTALSVFWLFWQHVLFLRKYPIVKKFGHFYSYVGMRAGFTRAGVMRTGVVSTCTNCGLNAA